MDSDKVSTSGNENRKSAKPIMEKKRRARINASLAELKSLLLEVIKKEGQRHSKMEKADILEMTVNHLRQLQRNQFSVSTTSSDPSILNKYRLGFNECATEVSRYLSSMDGIDVDLRARLLNHLANCMTASTSTTPVRPQEASTASPSVTSTTPALLSRRVEQVSPATTTTQQPDIAVSSLPTTLSPKPHQITLSPSISAQVVTRPSIIAGTSGNMVLAPKPQVATTTTLVSDNSNKFTPVQPAPNLQMTNVVNGLQIVPTKMPSGDIALVLPANVFGGAQIPNYVIPVYATPGLSSTSSSSLPVANVMTLGPTAPVTQNVSTNAAVAVTNLPKGYKLVPCSTTTRSDEPTTVFSLPSTSLLAPPTATVSIPPLLTLPSLSPSVPLRLGSNNSDSLASNVRHPGDIIQGQVVDEQDENVWRPW